MDTIQIDILNPKATKLLKNLEELKLIAIKKLPDDDLLTLVNKFRAKARKNPPTLAEITKEVETARSARYEKTKR
jgi:hypothetical protein